MKKKKKTSSHLLLISDHIWAWSDICLHLYFLSPTDADFSALSFHKIKYWKILHNTPLMHSRILASILSDDAALCFGEGDEAGVNVNSRLLLPPTGHRGWLKYRSLLKWMVTIRGRRSVGWGANRSCIIWAVTKPVKKARFRLTDASRCEPTWKWRDMYLISLYKLPPPQVVRSDYLFWFIHATNNSTTLSEWDLAPRTQTLSLEPQCS